MCCGGQESPSDRITWSTWRSGIKYSVQLLVVLVTVLVLSLLLLPAAAAAAAAAAAITIIIIAIAAEESIVHLKPEVFCLSSDKIQLYSAIIC